MTSILNNIKCSVGLQVGIRTFKEGGPVPAGYQSAGVFGLIGFEDPCHEPVVTRCQLMINGQRAPYWWWACAKPEHHRDAWEIEWYNEKGEKVRVEKCPRPLEEMNPPPPRTESGRDRLKRARVERKKTITVEGESVDELLPGRFK